MEIAEDCLCVFANIFQLVYIRFLSFGSVISSRTQNLVNANKESNELTRTCIKKVVFIILSIPE